MRHHFLRLTAATLAILAFDVSCRAQPGDVPPVAQHEIARRGSHVEQTGTIRSGLMAAALSPPADDSAKWFLTLVVKNNDRASAAMQATIANDPAMKPWIDTRETSKSMMHYQIRSIDDQTQHDWLESLRPAIAQSGVPLVVIQPPKNGQFGPSSTIVKLLSGVISGDELSKKVRAAMITYVDTLEPRGISQSSVITSAAPFVTPQQPAQPLMPPLEYPQITPPQVVPTPVPTPVVVTPNPTTPAPSTPTTSLALWILGAFAGGLITATMGRSVATKLSGLGTALHNLSELQKTVSVLKDQQSPKDE